MAVSERADLTDAGTTDAGTGSADDTSPLPVILNAGARAPEPPGDAAGWLPSRPPGPQPAAAQRPAPVPFQMPEPVPAPGQRPASLPEEGGQGDVAARPEHAAAADAKLEQIKDLYMTAEAIGEDALGRHFDELRQRQQSLIREYFQEMGLAPPGSATARGDDQQEGGGSVPD
jgi:hypothetical protein